jgi:hypothetical protein
MLFKHNLNYGKFFSPDGDGGGGAGAIGNSGEGNDGNAGNDGGTEGDGESGDSADLAGLKSALDKERKAARDAAKQVKALQAKLDEIENAGKPESEKLSRERDAAIQRAEAAEQRIRTANARTAVYEAVGSLASPRAVFALIKDDLDFDDDDMPTNVTDLIAREKKADPTLFRAAAGSGDGGKGGNVANTNDINATIRRMAGRTT